MTLFTEGRLQAFERMMQDTGKYHRREDSEDRPRKCPKKKVKPAKTDVLTPSSRELLLKLVFTSDQRSGVIRESDD